MAARSRRQRAQSAGRREAVKAHARLGTDLTQRIDVFRIIQATRIWLLFEPMSGVYGLYGRGDDDIAGILLNSNHPLPLQRLTAAHEYGHHALGHSASTDLERSISGTPDDAQEIAAQAFASEFLMPQPLINFTLRRLELPAQRDELTAADVYQLSIELGASFAATINQLRTLKFLSPRRANEIAKVRPLDLKLELLSERPDGLATSNVWRAGENDDGRRIYAFKNDHIAVSLPESPSTGYRWQLAPDAANESLRLAKDWFASPRDDDRIGAGGVHTFTLDVDRAGSAELLFVKGRSWETDSIPAATLRLFIDCAESATGGAERGLTADQRRYLLEAA